MKFVNKNHAIHIKRRPGKIHDSGLLLYENKHIPCRLGRSGIRSLKQEGDGATPFGRYALLYGYYRKDRITLPPTCFPFFAIQEDDGWCDDPTMAQYNHPVALPFKGSHEKLFRDDHLYDICIVLDYNLGPISKHRGSAIFFHLSSPDNKPTEGCVAIRKEQMLKLIPHLNTNTEMIINI